MEDIAEKRPECKKWNGLLCPIMHNWLQAALDKSSTWSIRTSNDNLYEVQRELAYVVDIALRTCFCGGWQHNEFPCSHAVAVLNNSSHLTEKDLMDYIEPYFYLSFYKKSLDMSIHPITTFNRVGNGIEDPQVLPPITQKLHGRPKNKRIPSRGEKVRMLRCSRCRKNARHNRKSCREIIAD